MATIGRSDFRQALRRMVNAETTLVTLNRQSTRVSITHFEHFYENVWPLSMFLNAGFRPFKGEEWGGVTVRTLTADSEIFGDPRPWDFEPDVSFCLCHRRGLNMQMLPRPRVWTQLHP